MALKKDITLDNGIVLNYHRIVAVYNVTNRSTMIEIASYLNQEQRNKEKVWYETDSNDNMNVYIKSTMYNIDYDKNMNVDSAYEYLKTLDEFKDAEDVLEEPKTEYEEENYEESTITDEIKEEE